MEWLHDHVRQPKGPDYAQRVLDRYRLGMKARGAIRGVRILTGPDSCPTCRVHAGIVYRLDDAPIVPIAGCSHPGGCHCAYSAVMTYEE
ncbi:MAG TPA: hypothetical protein VNL16_11120 [Chloroflexota bacterium]|nr:hypothetical protein [Chloroflexota bacterium]